MATLVADTSGLVSLGIAADESPDPLVVCLDAYDVLIPTAVVDELQEVASYDDQHGQAAAHVLDHRSQVTVASVTLDATFPLDDGENAAVTLANERDTDLLLCDEFSRLGLVHASLADTRLVTTPTLLSVFVRTERLSVDEARACLEAVSAGRSWATNSYVQRARALLDD
ncbi:MAG: hypothetical protein ABEJ43_07355 [Haloferacaceae archaeon]